MILVPGNVKSAILLALLLLAHALPAQAALLCSESGPDSADGYLELSDFEVTGPEPLRMGDTVTVSFTLKATRIPIQFDKQGAFVAARDPDGIDRNFGHAYRGHWLQVDESISVQANTTVDKEGEWIFLPVYSSRTGRGDIVRTASMVESDYANPEIGECLVIRHFGTKYMAINGKPNILSPILVEMDEAELQMVRLITSLTSKSSTYRLHPIFVTMNKKTLSVDQYLRHLIGKININFIISK